MFYMFALFLQVMYATPETWAGRMLYSSFLGFSFVMTASYTAQLASFLTYQGRKLYFRVWFLLSFQSNPNSAVRAQ